MLVYTLKSAACLAILFVFYKLFLEKESIHKFKRFYLLGALVFSLIVPVLVFTEYVEVEPPKEVTYTVTQPVQVSDEVINVPPALEADVIDIAPLLWGVYFLGLFFFGLKFIRNLFQIFRRIRKNPKYKLNRFTQVLLQEKITPHTFFSYIFLNKTKFESKQIPKEVLLHEETHAQQKHSWDVVFVELLQVIFWVNPFIYLAKKAIKLNHEFLADQAVLEKNIDETTYKNTLLSYLSPDSEKKYQPLANAINYSSIKKRFTIMKTQTSKKAILLRSLLLLPLLAIMLYGFSGTKTETIVADPIIESSLENKLKTDVISNRSVELAGLIMDAETLEPLESVVIYDDKGNQLSKTDVRGYYKVQFDDLGEGEIRFAYSLSKNGYKSVSQREHWGNLQGKIGKTFYFGLSKKESDTPEFSQHGSSNNLSYESVQNNLHLVQKQFEFNKKLNNAKKGNQDVLIEIDKTQYLVNDTGWIKINSKEDLISIDDNLIVPASEVNGILERKEITGMTPLEKNKKALFAIYTIPVNSTVAPISKASKSELKQFNSLAKKYNAVPIEKRKIPLSDLKVLETVFKKMTAKQKQSAQPFPECLPKNSQEGASRKLMAEYTTLAKKYNTMLSKSKSIQIKMKDVDRLEYIYGLMSDKQKADAEPYPDFPKPPPPPKEPKAPKAPRVLKGEVSNIPPPPPVNAPKVLKGEVSHIPPPPPPPEPQSPLDHVIEMAKKGATFYYEGKKVTSDKGIELLKKNEDLNIQITGESSKNPTVKISKEPIYLDRSAVPSSIETGNIEIKGDEGFYSKKDGITSYFNSNGEQINIGGQVLNKKSENNPKFYFKDRQISSKKANRLLSSNISIQMTSKEYKDGGYAILLTDLNSPSTQNVNRNPNSVIDLTEMISKDALFFHNDKPITTEKALWLTQNNLIERVNTIRPKKGKPKVYFWDKA